MNEDDHKPLTSVLLMLTPFEAKELLDKLTSLSPEANEHCHINNADFSKEVTITIYTSENQNNFSPDIRRLLDIESNIT
ncbi:MAG: hypothetical protein GY753_06075 [Gammaproteobacteria bacterium]|nr:hypothetical protein [Gammaproteobacteria bacterium]